jgi:hypothetical protein
MTIDPHAAIIPGIGLGGLKLHNECELTNLVAADVEPMLWENVGWDGLRAYCDTEATVVVFVDATNRIRGLYATPRYKGKLFDSIRTGITGRKAKQLRPSLYFWSVYAALKDCEVGGYCLTSEVLDCGEETFLDMKMLFIAVYDEAGSFYT